MSQFETLQRKNGLIVDMLMHGTKSGNGWDDCPKAITNKEVFGEDIPDKLIVDVMLETEYGPPEKCSECGGMKVVLGRLLNRQHLQCRDCGAWFQRPIVNGIVITAKEELEEF